MQTYHGGIDKCISNSKRGKHVTVSRIIFKKRCKNVTVSSSSSSSSFSFFLFLSLSFSFPSLLSCLAVSLLFFLSLFSRPLFSLLFAHRDGFN